MSPQPVELRRLAALLRTDPEALAFLGKCDAAALVDLRRRITAAGSARHARTFERLTRASALMPAPLAARITRDVLGPEIAAQLLPFMSVERAVQVSRHLPAAFQAEVTLHMVPESSSELLAAIPDEIRQEVTRELLGRGEYAVMGVLVDVLPENLIAALAAEIADPVALLGVTMYVNEKSRLETVVASFPDAQIDALLAAAAQRAQMTVLCELTAAVSPGQQRRVANVLAKAKASVRRSWAEAWDAGVHGVDPAAS